MQVSQGFTIEESTVKNIDSICDGAVWCILDGERADIVYLTEKACQLFGIDSFDEFVTSHEMNLWEYFKEQEKSQTNTFSLNDLVDGYRESLCLNMYMQNQFGTPVYFEFSCHIVSIDEKTGKKLMRGKIYFIPVYDSLREEKTILDTIENGMVIVKKMPDSYPIVFANKAFCKTIGKDANPLTGGEVYDFKDFISSVDCDVFSAFVEKISNSLECKVSYRVKMKNGRTTWYVASGNLVLLGNVEHIIINLTGINEIMRTQSHLKEEKEKWNNIVNSVPIGLLILSIEKEFVKVIAINDRLVQFANILAYKLSGKEGKWTKDELTGIFDKDIYAFAHKLDRQKVKKMIEQARDCGYSDCIFRLKGSKPDNPIWVRSLCSCTERAGKEFLYITLANATNEVNSIIELQKNHDEFRKLSLFDPLTKVHSRNAYNELCYMSKKGNMQNTGVIFADVNGLKATNDTYGHIYGDNMICSFADILRQDFENEEIYRISGDEFVVISKDITRTEFIEKVKHIRALVDQENNIASIGYIWEESTSNLLGTISAAEQLMYVEKQQYYSMQAAHSSKHHKDMVDNFSRELQNGQFEMYLQPKSNIDNTYIIGAEALVRKKDINGKMVFPDDFIPLLEHEKIIPSLDYFMLEQVCRTIKRWESEGRRRIKISVNLSRVTMAENNFLERIISICDKYDIDRSLVEYEITESNATMDHKRMLDEVFEMKKEGFFVSLDDMGSDYSALRMLLVEGIDIVKLDRSFVLQMDTFKGRTLIENVIKMSHDLGYTCVAEGVETDEQREKLKQMGCDMYQGYLLSKPVPIEEFEKLM